MHNRYTSICAVLMGVFLSAELSAWTSARVYPSGSGLAYTEDAEGTRIPDFGHAGYHEGCMDPPVVSVIATLTPVAGDNTANINNAISALASRPMQANGYRGALLLRPGTYNVSGLVLVNVEGVVLRGSGDGTDPATNTIIFSTNTSFDVASNRGEYSVIRAGHSGYANNGFRTTGTSVQITSNWVKVGQASFTVSDVTPFAVGDEVVITHPFTAAFLSSIDNGGTETAAPWSTSNGPLIFQRRITAIDSASKTVTVNVGMSHHLKRTLTQCTMAKLDTNRFIKHVGVEDLRVMVTHTSDTDEHHAKSAIELNQTFHSHVRNISAKDYWHAAVIVRGSSYATVMDSRGEGFAGIVTGERGYTFSAESHSSNILFKRVWASGGRHNFIASSGFTSHLIVFHDSDSYSAKGGGVMEAHMHWSTGLLLDNVRHNTDQAYLIIGLYSRGDYGTNHGWACANCVAWNSNVGPRGDIVIQKPPTAQNYAIGCFGDQITGTKPPAPFNQPTGYIEGSKVTGLNPASLYLAQVAARTDCAVAASPTPSRTATRTNTSAPSPTRTSTPTFSATRSNTALPSATRSTTPTFSATRSSSPSATRTPFATGTVTRSWTASPSATPTLSPSLTRSASPTGTAGNTSLPTGTRSATPTFTATRSNTSLPTATSNATPISSATSSVTAAPSGTQSHTPVATASATPSEMSSATATFTSTSSPTAIVSASATPSASSSQSATAQPSFSVTASKTASPSVTRTATPSSTPTGTVSAPPSSTATPTSSLTPSATATSSGTPMATAIATSAATATASPSASPTTQATSATTFSATPTSTSTSIAPNPGGELELIRAVIAPNPCRGAYLNLAYESKGPADTIVIEIYAASSLVKVKIDRAGGPSGSGWHQASFAAHDLPRGPYAFRAYLLNGAGQSNKVSGKFMRLD